MGNENSTPGGNPTTVPAVRPGSQRTSSSHKRHASRGWSRIHELDTPAQREARWGSVEARLGGIAEDLSTQGSEVHAEVVRRAIRELAKLRTCLHAEIARHNRTREERDYQIEQQLTRTLEAIRNGAQHCSICRSYHGMEVIHVCE